MTADTKFKKGYVPWNKGKKCPTLSASIDKEQRSLVLKSRWDNDPEYASKARKALEETRHNPKSKESIEKNRASHKLEMASHPINCQCPMHRHYQTTVGIANMAAFFRGRKLTKEHKAKIGRGFKNHPVDCKCAAHYWIPGSGARHPVISKPQLKLYQFFLDAGLQARLEEPFGKYSIDIYLPEFHLGIEVDGIYWHNLPGAQSRDKRKDWYLKHHHDLAIARFWETEAPIVTR